MFESNGTVNPRVNEFIIKKELAPVVKSENVFDELPFEIEAISRFGSKAHIASLQKEKENVIAELLSVKGENQKLYMQLHHKQNEITKLNRLMLEHNNQHTGHIQTITAELNDLKQKYEVEKMKRIEHSKTISSLMRDKQLLSAEVKQLQAPHYTTKMPKKENTSDSDNEFEVEYIMSHKIVRNKRLFWVRWKGYSESHDSWVKEKDLNCPIVLEKYLKDHNKKQ